MVGSRSTATRVTLGAVCLSNSSHFAPKPYSYAAKPVMLPPGRAKGEEKPAPTGSGTPANTIGTVRVARCNAPSAALPEVKITSGASATSFRRIFARVILVASGPAVVDLNVVPDGPTQLLQPLQKCRVASLHLRVVRGERHEHAHAPHGLALLRARRERPRHRRAAEKRDELAPSHCLPRG